jgi:hypothetical protein
MPQSAADIPAVGGSGFHQVGQDPDLPAYAGTSATASRPAPVAAPPLQAAAAKAAGPSGNTGPFNQDGLRDTTRRPVEAPARHEKKPGKILPWFLQDSDTRSGE